MSSKSTPEDLGALMDRLGSMPSFLREHFQALSAREATQRGPSGDFAPVEQCWHLADLEREGFGVRITRLLQEKDPFFPDFEGDRIAEERQYAKRSLLEGLAAFEQARAINLSCLRAVRKDQWSRAGQQDGIGLVSLRDIPRQMLEHDAAHRSQIEEWWRARGSRA